MREKKQSEHDLIDEAVKELSRGKLIGLPTETVYGLAAPINNISLINRIFELKKRPFFDPLIVHVASVEQAKSLVNKWSPVCEDIAEKFWPGPVTLVLEKKNNVSDLITSGLTTVGIRIPRSKVARDFIDKLGTPVAAPSANMFKKISPTCAKHVEDVFSHKDVFVLDDGPCQVGIESTIIKVLDKSLEILRPGLVSISELSEIAHKHELGIVHSKSPEVKAPGMLEEHYQPTKPLYVVIENTLEAAKNKAPDKKTYWFNLSEKPELAARELYQSMREACGTNHLTCSIWLKRSMVVEDAWRGIVDRLRKASSGFIE